MPLGVIVHDPASKPQYLNQLALQIFNLADKQENLKPNVARPLQETTQQYPLYLAETSQPYPFERLPVVQALGGQKATANDLEVDIGGRRVSLEVSAAPIFNEQGQVQYAISAFQDISERKKAEVALRHSEMQLQLALKAGQLGIWNWDIVTNKVQWSAEVETIFGLPPGAFAGTYHAYLELLHPEDQPQVAQRIQQALDRMEDYRIEHRVLLPNGAVRWLAGQGKVLGDETGHPIRMVGTVQDITERKQLEERLAAIYHLGQELTLLHDETAVARQVLDTALPMLRAEAAGYAVVDEAAGELVYWFHGPGITLLSPYLRLPLNGPQGLEVAVVHSGQPLNISDTSQEARYVAGPGDWIGGSALYAPLKIGQNVSGVLVVESLASNHFTPADQLIFQTLADQAAVAIENARLFEQVQTYSAELEQRVAARTAELQQVNQQLQQEIAERQRAEEAYQVLVENSLQGFAIFQDDRVVFANSKVAQEFTGYTLEELKTMTPNQINELVHPEDQALVQAHVEDRLKEKRLPPNYEFRIICKDGQVRWLEIFATLAEYRGRPAIQAAYIDITERKQAEAKIRRQNEYLNTLYQITLDLLNRRHVDDLLQTILIRATELLDATYGEILQLEGEALVTRICTPNQAFLRGDRIQRGEGLLSWRAFDTGQPILLDDYATWPERRAVYNPVELHATLDIPIMVGQNCLGVVALGRDRLGYVFDSEQLRVGLLFAQLAGLVLDNAHWRVQAEQAAVAMERNRLAQDLHDAVTQSLFSASVIAEALPRIWEQHPGEARHGLEELRLLTRGALAEMRSLLLELRPAGLVENKLGDLLAHLTEAFRSRTRLPITLTVTGHYSLPPEVQIIFYYFAQEALNNIAKHAAASQIILELLLEADSIRLSICDDGCGFNPENIPPGHLGLLIMRERANKIGATLTIQSQLGQGTQLHLWLATASFPSVVSSKNGEWRT
jgi:two-component system nitrate/nitrite sensor histidine kinase NarX